MSVFSSDLLNFTFDILPTGIKIGSQSGLTGSTGVDTDGDCIPDEKDTDLDGDGVPNACDGDIDGDGVPNRCDTTPAGPILRPVPRCKPKSTDTDGDGVPDYKDPDIDGDGVPNRCDPTPTGVRRGETKCIKKALKDTDGDGIPDRCDPTPTGVRRRCPPKDTDGDGVPDYKDPDIDGDDIPNRYDPTPGPSGAIRQPVTVQYLRTTVPVCPVPVRTKHIAPMYRRVPKDTDRDGIPDRKDADIDGDGVPNGADPTPKGPVKLFMLRDGFVSKGDTETKKKTLHCYEEIKSAPVKVGTSATALRRAATETTFPNVSVESTVDGDTVVVTYTYRASSTDVKSKQTAIDLGVLMTVCGKVVENITFFDQDDRASLMYGSMLTPQNETITDDEMVQAFLIWLFSIVGFINADQWGWLDNEVSFPDRERGDNSNYILDLEYLRDVDIALLDHYSNYIVDKLQQVWMFLALSSWMSFMFEADRPGDLQYLRGAGTY